MTYEEQLKQMLQELLESAKNPIQKRPQADNFGSLLMSPGQQAPAQQPRVPTMDSLLGSPNAAQGILDHTASQGPTVPGEIEEGAGAASGILQHLNSVKKKKKKKKRPVLGSY